MQQPLKSESVVGVILNKKNKILIFDVMLLSNGIAAELRWKNCILLSFFHILLEISCCYGSVLTFLVAHSNIMRCVQTCTFTHVGELSQAVWHQDLSSMFYSLLVRVVCRSGTQCYPTHTHTHTEAVGSCLRNTVISCNLDFYNSSSLLKSKWPCSSITVPQGCRCNWWVMLVWTLISRRDHHSVKVKADWAHAIIGLCIEIAWKSLNTPLLLVHV